MVTFEKYGCRSYLFYDKWEILDWEAIMQSFRPKTYTIQDLRCVRLLLYYLLVLTRFMKHLEIPS